jgi:hypothetical protein
LGPGTPIRDTQYHTTETGHYETQQTDTTVVVGGLTPGTIKAGDTIQWRVVWMNSDRSKGYVDPKTRH